MLTKTNIFSFENKNETVVRIFEYIFTILTPRIEQQNRSILICERPFGEFRKANKEKVIYFQHTILSHEIIPNRCPTVTRRCT